MSKYIGITIGPIFDMMSLVSTPAALWATSYMFSSISKKTCEKLYNENVEIISPYFDNPKNVPLFNKNDGVGLFHDRIIMSSVGITLERINEIKNDVLKEVSKDFFADEDVLSKRILFVAAEFDVADSENPILKGGKILDSLELSRKIMFKEDKNPILEHFTGDLPSDEDRTNKEDKEQKKSKNDKIKETAKNALGIEPKNWQLLTKYGTIKSLPDIANAVPGSKKKKYSYYAIVRSDGDNMSQIIKSLQVSELSAFSENCLHYCADVANLVTKYKGVPVYSSGDDLLAIMPADSGNGETVFRFISEVNRLFSESFKIYTDKIKSLNQKISEPEKQIPVPSLSFGITICYNKFPLYEALEDSAELLFDIAKSKKDCSVVRLQKHSGQSEGLLIYNDALDDFLKIHDVVLSRETESENAAKNQDAQSEPQNQMSELLLSALYKTEKFKKLFTEAKDEIQINNLFKNTFDAPDHSNNDFVHLNLPEFYAAVCTNGRILALSDEGLEKELNNITVFNFALRILKFFVENGGEEQKKNGRKNG